MKATRMSIAEVAAELDVSRWTALRLVRAGTVPGGERMYRFEGRNGERWMVNRSIFVLWRADSPNSPSAPNAPNSPSGH